MLVPTVAPLVRFATGGLQENLHSLAGGMAISAASASTLNGIRNS
jgi:hypothetical protein